MTTVKNIYDYINSVAPFDKQEEWDNSGFLIGEFRKEVKTVVISLDATKNVARFAESVSADLLLTHHPVIFNPINKIKSDSAVYSLVKSDIAVISAHTSFDVAKDGINDNLAALLQLENTRHLPDGILVAGDLRQGMSIDDFALFVAEVLDCHGLRYTDSDKIIKSVAVGGGACEDYMQSAMENADCFVTGELKYHHMLEADEVGYPVIAAGHYETENIPFLMLKNKLEKIFTDVEFIIAPRENPVLEI
ncbi:MAG: Nif3-like dinuclear metal center hexameric protein [Clostridiales bacterium]|nr:Nif3-like dinuclear metal center hexameric protein [Clostridiales bacterium]